jgi:putative heme iron utilization protein
MPERMSSLVGEYTEPTDALLKKWAGKDGKKKLLADLLQQYQTLYDSSKGKTTEKLSIRVV